MSEALHALPSVVHTEQLTLDLHRSLCPTKPESPIKQETLALGDMNSVAFFDDSSQNNSLDRILKLLHQEPVFEEPVPGVFPPHFSFPLHHVEHSYRDNNQYHQQEVLRDSPDNETDFKCIPEHNNTLITADPLSVNREDLSGDQDPHSYPLSFENQCRQEEYEGYDCYQDKFQFILSVPTSTAVRNNEDTLSYLNQGQSYEIKIKKLGDITNCFGRKYTSVVRFCFHERRYQYVEKQQLALWQEARPNERLIEVDIPLSVAISEVKQCENKMAAVEFNWDPCRDAAVFIKVNCISTEFTQKKHGGEKGVPFRIQIETYHDQGGGSMERVHVCGCQVKVFKLKGADRKHKQDRDKICKLAPTERDKFQTSTDCTILKQYTGDMIYQPSSREGSSGSSTPSSSPLPPNNVVYPELSPQFTASPMDNRVSPISQKGAFVTSPPLKESSPSDSESSSSAVSLTLEGGESSNQLQLWLVQHRFNHCCRLFANYSAQDLLRLTRDEYIQLIGLADGIRLHNLLRAGRQAQRITLYILTDYDAFWNAVYLERCSTEELTLKLSQLYPALRSSTILGLFVQGPNGIHVRLTDEVIANLPDESLLKCSSLASDMAASPLLKPPRTPTPRNNSIMLLFKVIPKNSNAEPYRAGPKPSSSGDYSHPPNLPNPGGIPSNGGYQANPSHISSSRLGDAPEQPSDGQSRRSSPSPPRGPKDSSPILPLNNSHRFDPLHFSRSSDDSMFKTPRPPNHRKLSHAPLSSPDNLSDYRHSTSPPISNSSTP